MSEKTKLMPKPKPKLMPKPKQRRRPKPKDREALPIVGCNGVILFAESAKTYASKWIN